MVDFVSKENRSKIMASIKSKWTNPEKIVHNNLKGMRIRHVMHPKMEGNPDVLIKDKKIVIYINGCFWHKCARCYKEPTSNTEYWIPKMEANQRRDKKKYRKMKSSGYRVIRIWEHEFQNESRLKLKLSAFTSTLS